MKTVEDLKCLGSTVQINGECGEEVSAGRLRKVEEFQLE